MTNDNIVIIISILALFIASIEIFVIAHLYYKIKSNELLITKINDILKNASDNILAMSQYIAKIGEFKKKDLIDEIKWEKRFKDTTLIMKIFNDRLLDIESIVK